MLCYFMNEFDCAQIYLIIIMKAKNEEKSGEFAHVALFITLKKLVLAAVGVCDQTKDNNNKNHKKFVNRK